MAKMPNQKLKLIYLSRIFSERTDRYHGLTLSEISSALGEYNISAERKSLYDDIEALKLSGMDIRTVRDSHVRYYLASRSFELAELRLLSDAVQSSKFLTEKKSRELVRKLESLGSRYEAASLHRQDDSDGRLKTENEEIFQNVTLLHTAMSENRRIVCKYFEWNEHKQRRLRKNGDEYVLSPFALRWDDEYYYLIAYDSDAQKIKHFRIDKMIRIRLLEEKREGAGLLNETDLSRYSQRAFGMYGGEQVNVRILADNALAGVVIDRFGTEIPFLNRGDRFEFCVKVMVSPTFFSWVLGFGSRMRILSPESVAEEARNIAKSIVDTYETPIE
ncbi:MAG: WYL domain-containing protein [Clostridia bacterium]|nr:WYL domain-containing protein [Clostridia bacterium]